MNRSLRRILHPVAGLLVLLALGCVRKAAPPPAPPSLPVPSPAIPPDVRERFRSTLSPEAVAACPVTRPNVFYPPGFLPDIEMAGYNVRNREATLWARLEPEGALLFYPGGPGRVEPDGSLSGDMSWYRMGLTGPLRVEGRRLDAPAPPLSTASVGEGPETGAQTVRLTFPTEGCWALTARVGAHALTVVIRVIRVPFEIPVRSGPRCCRRRSRGWI